MSDNSHIFLLQVFNRWGKKIFESHDILRGWDGTLNGTRQPEGNYVWVLNYQDKVTKVENISRGTIMLIR